MFLWYDGYYKYISRFLYSVCFKFQHTCLFRHTRLFRPTCLLFFSKVSTIHIYSDTTFIRDRRVGQGVLFFKFLKTKIVVYYFRPSGIYCLYVIVFYLVRYPKWSGTERVRLVLYRIFLC